MGDGVRGPGVYYYYYYGGEGTEGGLSEMLLLECDCGLDNVIPDFLSARYDKSLGPEA